MSGGGPMKVSAAGDANEKQADAVADAVAARGTAGPTITPPTAQREASEDAAVAREAMVEREGDDEANVAPQRLQRAEDDEAPE